MAQRLPLNPAVSDVLAYLNLDVTEVLGNGPRYSTLLVHYGDKPAIFKMVLPEDPNATYRPPQRLVRVMSKEILLLEFLDHHQAKMAFYLPRIYQSSIEVQPWYLRETIEGDSMAVPGFNFVFRDDFFDIMSPKQIVKAFHDLHSVSGLVDDELALRMEHTRHDLNIYEGFANWQHVVSVLPQFAQYHDKIEAFFDKVRPVYDIYMRDHRYAVIGHNEPYPCHIFDVDGRVGLIDWENAGWTNRLRDLSNIWVRAFMRPDWQAGLVAELERIGYLDKDGLMVWQTEILMQSIANRGYFHTGGEGSEEFKTTARNFFETNVHDILKQT